MGWIIGVALMAIVAFSGFLVTRTYKDKRVPITNHRTGEQTLDVHAAYVGGWAAVALMFLGIVLLTVFSSFQIVSPGHEVLVKEFGKYTSQRGSGFVIVPPWADTQDVSIQVRAAEFDHLTAFSRETQDVFVDLTINYSLSPTAARQLYTKVGPNWYDRLFPARVLKTIKEATVQYRAVDEAPNREAIADQVLHSLRTQLSPPLNRGGYSIDIQGVQIRNLDFDQSFKDAILAKQRATQDAQTARNRVAQSQAEADQAAATADGERRVKIKQAQGDAQATLVKADAQSRANRELAASLTPQLVQYTLIQQLAPTIRTILLPSSGTGTILPGEIFGNTGSSKK
jgi:regulator of protease activity HflC (stomatin/prohibitin superfamily)